MMSSAIATLSEASRSLLRSTTILTSLPQIVFELVQNSLDARSSQIDVGVDLEIWECWVRDNGHGMDETGVSILAKGGEEGRYGEPCSRASFLVFMKSKGTSKAYSFASLEEVSTFGFRGEGTCSCHLCV